MSLTSAVPLVATWPQPAIAPRRSPRSGERAMRGELPQPKQALLPIRCASSLAGHIATWLAVRHRHRNPSKNGRTFAPPIYGVKRKRPEMGRTGLFAGRPAPLTLSKGELRVSFTHMREIFTHTAIPHSSIYFVENSDRLVRTRINFVAPSWKKPETSRKNCTKP